ncbi:hypothetical protein ACJ41O_000362 [Fusarium nematophilum]
MASFFSKPVSVSSSIGGKHITDAPPIPRESIGPAAIHLENELQKMYWKGVERELPYLLLTMRRWQSREDSSTLLPDEEDAHIHGYDTFLDQVSQSSREFHERNKRYPTLASRDPPTYEEALKDRARDIFASMKSQRIRDEIRSSLDDRKPLDPARRRARMLLQAAQFLDMDKIIEYREPEQSLSFWKRPAPAQITVSSYDELDLPVFVPQRCFECKAAIRGCMFQEVDNPAETICETCYRASHYGQVRFLKKYKQCCLTSAITAPVSRKLCGCGSVRRRDNDGRLRCLWPIDPELDKGEHIKGGKGRASCGLYHVTDLYAEAKYATTRSKIEADDTLVQMKRREDQEAERAGLIKTVKKRPTKLQHVNEDSIPEFGYSYGFSTRTPEAIPLYLRSTIDTYPYGNVHMALRFGPIIIENGVANTMGGVLITSRDPPSLQVIPDPPDDIRNCLLLTGESDRALYSQVRPRVPKRYKAFMKQVVGGPFCHFFNPDAEDEIVDAFMEESARLVEEGVSFADQEAMLGQSTERMVEKLKGYMGSRVAAYISSLTARLLDPELQLRWHYRSNNCQMFCDKLIDRNLFGSLFSNPSLTTKIAQPGNPSPLYLMSFVCRQGAYVKTRAVSKFDVPNGLTEEYLLKFRYGRHDDSDIIDTLAEYWYDWGGFEGPIYPYQDVFPWDCTEAYERYPGNCGQCNISKHVLAFPFDSWSIASLHLARGRELYPRDVPLCAESEPGETTSTTGLMTDGDWFRNRLTILLGQDSLLAAAVAMAKCGEFRATTQWLQDHRDESMDRLKLGGIHRAQPFSHHFEKGAYHQYFIADWTHLVRSQRVAQYEKLRGWRAASVDVGKAAPNNNDDGGCGGGACGGAGPYSCGAMAAGCAAGAPGVAGDTCGSDCVSSCATGGDGDGGCGGCGD